VFETKLIGKGKSVSATIRPHWNNVEGNGSGILHDLPKLDAGDQPADQVANAKRIAADNSQTQKQEIRK
jgi:hypothetical protein